MKSWFAPCITLFLLLPVQSARANDLKQCSTEKVNHEDCTVVIDRRYPLTLPTIQMSPGKKVIVLIQEPLAFETLTLDETSATALPGTDQGAALLTAAVPDLKGFVWSNVTVPNPSEIAPNAVGIVDPEEKARIDALNNTLQVLKAMLDRAQNSIPDDKSDLVAHIEVIYAQLNQILAPIPKPGSKSNKKFVPPSKAPGTPDPWTDYEKWRNWMLCELVGGTIDAVDCKTDTNVVPPHPTEPTFNNILGEIVKLQTRLPTTPPATPPDDPLFDQNTFAALVKQAKSEIEKLTDDEDKKKETAILDSLRTRQNNLNSRVIALANTLTNVQKDFLTYYQNIYLAKYTPPLMKPDCDGTQIPNTLCLGTIYDPKSSNSAKQLVAYTYLLGRQVVFSLNAVNNISTPVNSVTATTAKISIATITVLYADPRFETSAGAVFSFVHNRTFSNQTITTPPTGSGLMPGDIVIFQNKTLPEVVPFVAAHYRLGHDFAPAWLGHRRTAFYATAWLGLNPYTTLPEYGGGPTFSWRSFMFSALYSRAHESVLTQGLSVTQPVCSPTAVPGASPPPCTPTPPAPTTMMRAINAFAIGFSIRIPTSFAAGTGGVSR
jgi:hypothetical protein